MPLKISLTATDVYNVQRTALLRVSRYLGINDADLNDNQELHDLITTRQDSVISLLDQFLSAYWDYFNFFELHKNQGELTSGEQIELQQLIASRNATRSELIRALTERGF